MRMKRSKAVERGFTLAEMLAVVAMVGILATLAVYGVRKYVFAAKSSEAMTMVNAIKAHQEAFRDETFTYYDVTSDGGHALTPLYPMDPPNGTKYAWWNETDKGLYARWRRLGADAGGGVTFGYACAAGSPSDPVADPGANINLNFPTPVEPWYVIKAVGDQNGDGKNKTIVVASSFTREVHVENEGE
jgi:type IV pilus assembly protein PilA